GIARVNAAKVVAACSPAMGQEATDDARQTHHFARGIAAYRAGDYPSAADELQRSRETSFFPSRGVLDGLFQSMALWKLGRYAEARQLFQDMVAYLNNDPSFTDVQEARNPFSAMMFDLVRREAEELINDGLQRPKAERPHVDLAHLRLPADWHDWIESGRVTSLQNKLFASTEMVRATPDDAVLYTVRSLRFSALGRFRQAAED